MVPSLFCHGGYVKTVIRPHSSRDHTSKFRRENWLFFIDSNHVDMPCLYKLMYTHNKITNYYPSIRFILSVLSLPTPSESMLSSRL